MKMRCPLNTIISLELWLDERRKMMRKTGIEEK